MVHPGGRWPGQSGLEPTVLEPPGGSGQHVVSVQIPLRLAFRTAGPGTQGSVLSVGRQGSRARVRSVARLRQKFLYFLLVPQ